MAHSVCTSQGDLAHFGRLWDILLAPDAALTTRLEQLFAQETAEFGLEYGFFSRIDPQAERQHFQVVHGSHDQLRADNSIPLSVTYCRHTITASGGTLAISDALAEGWGDDPAYDTFGLGSYIGTTVFADSGLYGTLCFASSTPRAEPFTEAELKLLEMYGQWVTYELTQWSETRTQDVERVDLAGYEITSSQLDQMMDVLGNQVRRLILFSLLENAQDNIVDLIEDRTDLDQVEPTLHHIHLPKLEDAGYIETGPDSELVVKGPNFSEIEPFLRQLVAYRDE